MLSKYFGTKQGDKSRYNLATSYHLTVTLDAFMAGLEVEVWASFITQNVKNAAISSYLGVVTVL